jgi:hypothetical protein
MKNGDINMIKKKNFNYTFTDFVTEKFALYDTDEVNDIFSSFFDSSQKHVWGIKLLEEYEENKINEKQFNILLFISSFYDFSFFCPHGNSIPEVMLAQKAVKLIRAAKYADIRDNIEMKKIINKKCRETAALLRNCKNQHIPKKIFEKVMKRHIIALEKSADMLKDSFF